MHLCCIDHEYDTYGAIEKPNYSIKWIGTCDKFSENTSKADSNLR